MILIQSHPDFATVRKLTYRLAELEDLLFSLLSAHAVWVFYNFKLVIVQTQG